MDKRLIIVFVVLAGLGFLYLALSNESDSDTEGEDTSAVVAQAAAEDSVLRKYELLEKLSTDGGNDVGFTAEVSNIFATLRSVKMVKAQYYQTDNTERSSGLPAEDRGNIPERYYAEGQLELISTWDPKRYPFQAGFDRSGSDKKSLTDVEVTRVLRDVISKATVDPNRPLDLKVPEDHADLLSAIPTIQKGDFVQVVSTEGPATKLIPIVKVKDEATLELGEKLAEGVEFRIIAKGKFSDLMKRDPRFARVAMDEGKSLTYVWPDPENDDSTLFFERKLTVGEDAPYVVDVEHRLFNFGAVLDPVREHVDVIAFQPKVEGGGLFSGPAPDQRSALCHAGGEVYRGTLAEYLDDKKDEDWSPNGSVSWAGVDSRYFMLAVVPSDQENSYCKILGLPTKPPKPPVGVLGTRLGVRGEKKRLLGADPDSCRPFWLNQDDHKARPVCGEGETTVGSNVYQSSFQIYVGPKDLSQFKAIDAPLDDSIDFWIVGVIAKPMVAALQLFHEWIPSWGVAILILTVLVKLLLFPLTQWSFKSMASMQRIKPDMDELKKKFANDRQKLNEEMMALYKRNKVNPMGGCFPMLLQMPIWIALYRSIYSSVELYQAPLGGWIQDLSAPDPYYVLPLVMGLSMFLQQRLMPTSLDNQQAKIMMWMMPIMFTGFMLFLPSGLVLYILVNTLLSMAQQYYIKRKDAVPPAAKAKKA